MLMLAQVWTFCLLRPTRFSLRVLHHVSFHIGYLSKAFTTNRAAERFLPHLSRVLRHVALQISSLCEPHTTDRAAERLLS